MSNYKNIILFISLFTLSFSATALDRFTKIDANGTVMPANATGHQCVYDDTTYLLWEVKTDDGGLRDKDWTYSWYFNDVGYADNGNNCYDSSRCDTEKFAADVNAAGGLCGITTGWVVPSKDQLVSIVDNTVSNPSINTNYFPNTVSGWFWTATPYDSSASLVVSFYGGYVFSYARNGNGAARLVRSGQWLLASFALNINKLGAGLGTITSSPAGINCGSSCSAQFSSLNSTVKVALTATPAAGSTFAGWSSNCANGQVNMTANTTCSATFNLIPYAPVASTEAPSLIVLNRVTLKGTVNPKGAVTAASFDYGPSTSYGNNIIATPASIAATAAATSVSATATFDCNTTYHYRTKAVNSVGTAYGTDKTFTTTCSAGSTQLTNGVAATNQTITANAWKYFYLSVPAGADTLKFVTSGGSTGSPGDIDIYAQVNALPVDPFACSSENGGSIETCQPATTTAGTWWLGVFAYEDSTFNVTGSFREPQTISAITFNPTTLTAGHTTTASATASSGLAVTFTTTTPDICSINGNTVQGTHIGTCIVTANQAGNGNYVPATAVTKNITVGQGAQTITLTCNPANITVGTTANCTASATSGLTPTVTAAPSSICTLSGTTLTGVAVGNCTVTAKQTGNTDYLAATTVTTPIPVAQGENIITLTCAPLSIPVSGTATCTATASSGLTPSLSVVDPSICSISSGTVTGLVAGFCTVKAKQIGNTNYKAATPVTKNIQVGNVVMYTVTPTPVTNGTVTPNTPQQIIQDTKTSFTVTADTGYTTNPTVTGSCPQDSWNGNKWTTGPIIANCDVKFSFDPKTYPVTATAGTGGTVTPATSTVTHGLTTNFAVTPDTDYTINNTVTGTCLGGNWSGNTWTTGIITAACSVNFSFTYNPVAVNGVCGTANGSTFSTTPNANLCSAGDASAVTSGSTGSPPVTVWQWTCQGINGGSNTSCTANITRYSVTVSTGSGGTVTPNTAQSVTAGSTASFTLAATNGYSTNSAVTGSCPQGSWNSNVWTTGPITTNCSVTFGFTPKPANAWLSPPSPIVKRDRPFTLDVTANSNTMKIASYKFTVTIDPAKLTFDTQYQNTAQTCVFGICPGTNALTSLIVDETDLNAGTLVLTGQDTQGGKGPGNDLQLAVAHLKTKTVLGTTPVTLITNKLNNPSGGSIGLDSRDSTVTVSPGLCGDADGNDTVNIVDALAIARKVVGLNPPPTVDALLADVDKNGAASIVDAMHIARYSVGLLTPPEVCAIGLPL